MTVKKVGNIVFLNGCIKVPTLTSNQWYQFAALPTGFYNSSYEPCNMYYRRSDGYCIVADASRNGATLNV